ncbi:AtpZ/AtpI family protein [Clostridia bacterium]|nr:AtpZ/AtpI family protein [Clostridia bacterium]
MKRVRRASTGVVLSTSYAGTMLVSMYLGYRVGIYVDGRLGTEPIFLILGLLLSIILGLYTVVKEILYFDSLRRKDD